MKRMFKFGKLSTLFAPLILGGCMTTGYEGPQYDVVAKIQSENGYAIEVRHYEPQVQATTTVAKGDSGFGILAGYIFGGNQRDESIAMTVPVMTQDVDQGRQMSFMMPNKYDMDSLPEPVDARVSFEEVPKRQVIAIVFSGWTGKSKLDKLDRELLSAASDNNIQVQGEPILNRYDPPWTLPFFRTNEIHYQLKLQEPMKAAKTSQYFNPKGEELAYSF